jgi:hypothetical protein
MSDYTAATEIRDAAHEIKFLLDRATARAVCDWARARLQPDLHGGGAFGDEYTTSTLYFDTDAFDVFHRHRSFGRSKYRVRRYGTSDVVFFERKLRRPALLVKRRTATGIADLPRLAGAAIDRRWQASWFHQRLLVRQLRPACRVVYRRTARLGMTAFGPMRLTLDADLRAMATRAYEVDGAGGVPAAPDHAILELKYRVETPALFKLLVAGFGLVPLAISKYRLGVTAAGLAQPKAPAPPAEEAMRA